jgi:hypothetical protein
VIPHPKQTNVRSVKVGKHDPTIIVHPSTDGGTYGFSLMAALRNNELCHVECAKRHTNATVPQAKIFRSDLKKIMPSSMWQHYGKPERSTLSSNFELLTPHMAGPRIPSELQTRRDRLQNNASESDLCFQDFEWESN